MIYKKSKLVLLITLFQLLYNNIIHWFPFTAGKSQNDLYTIDDNIVSIVINLGFYSLFLIILFNVRPRLEILYKHSKIIYIYCIFILIQSIFRSNLTMELIRSVSLIIMLISADWLGKYCAYNLSYLQNYMLVKWKILVSIIILGIAIGVVMPGSVNWGGGVSSDFISERAEYFFFFPAPFVVFSLSLMVFKIKFSKFSYIFSFLFTILVLILSIRTETRGLLIVLSLIFIIFLFSYNKNAIILIAIAGCLSVFLNLNLLDELGIINRFFSSDQNFDITNGRLDLNVIIFDSFMQSPLFGRGAEDIRAIIWASNSRAKTEHGYIMHLGTYGLFGILFYFYVVKSIYSSILIINREATKLNNLRLNKPLFLAVAAQALSWGVLGFIGVFGSATAFADWYAIFILSLTYSIHKLYY
jgi:hypothetical protein